MIKFPQTIIETRSELFFEIQSWWFIRHLVSWHLVRVLMYMYYVQYLLILHWNKNLKYISIELRRSFFLVEGTKANLILKQLLTQQKVLEVTIARISGLPIQAKINGTFGIAQPRMEMKVQRRKMNIQKLYQELNIENYIEQYVKRWTFRIS
jgi:hypothetical protein